MKLFPLPGQDTTSKLIGVLRAIPDIWDGLVLDVGCRSGELQRILATRGPASFRYVGVDLGPPASVVSNLETGLPFPNRTFKVVAALDVLEHTNQIHKAFSELCRVSDQYVLILLPNGFDLGARLRALRGLPMNGKYGLPIEPPADRHKWIFTLWEAQKFVRHMAPKLGFSVQTEGCVAGPRRVRVFGRPLCEARPNLFCQWYLALLSCHPDA